MADPKVEVLAAALVASGFMEGGKLLRPHLVVARAILAALDGWTLVSASTVDLIGRYDIAGLLAEIERLRKIEKAARLALRDADYAPLVAALALEEPAP